MPSVAIIGSRGYPSYYGGFETAVRRVAPHLADHGWGVSVYSRAGETRVDDPAADPRVTPLFTGGLRTRSLSTLSYGFTSSRDAIRRRPDAALVLNVANGFWLPGLARAGIPTLVNVDGIEWERAKWGALARRTFLAGARRTARFGTELVFDSRQIAKYWGEVFGREGIFIPYGADPAGDPLPVEQGLAHRGYVLMVARLVPENTVAEFFAAATAIAEHHPVVIVGSTGFGGALDDAAAAVAASSDRVRWLGHLSDDRRLHALWQHAGAYFHGHSVGGTNPALVQAMALGAPTVARDTPYNREVLDGHGVFVSPSPEAITGAVLELMADPRRQEILSQAGARRAGEEYTWARVSAAYDAALRGLIRAA